MPSILALDLSKRSTGYAYWSDGLARPVSGTWSLGSELTDHGTAFLRLHQNMHDLNRVSPFDIVIYEQPLNLDSGKLVTTAETTFTLIGLAAHVDSFCAAMRVRKVRYVNQSTWRRYFMGPMKRGTKSKQLKDYAMERCRQLGLSPRKHDEAEAIGILSYMCSLEGITPPWERDEILRPALGMASS